MSKQLVTIIFGGQSSEHEISCLSVMNVIRNLDPERFDMTLVGITKEGKWLAVSEPSLIESGEWRNSKDSVVFSPDASTKCYYILKNGAACAASEGATCVASEGAACNTENGAACAASEGAASCTSDNAAPITVVKPDVVFPVLHGLYGEDGSIQGLFELAKIPYVGCGVLASCCGMDKFATKTMVDSLGIRQAAWVGVYRHEVEEAEKTGSFDALEKRILEKLSYPVFVKPSRAGSSKGVSKANDTISLIAALKLAAEHDSKILVEESIKGRELECGVLGDIDIKASGVGEILSGADFYDFDAKYNDETSETVTDPDIPAEIREEIRTDAVKIFKILSGSGLSRVDFFWDAKGVVFNEINTMPGFTAISMYPMLWEAAGVSKKELVTKLISLAFVRSGE